MFAHSLRFLTAAILGLMLMPGTAVAQPSPEGPTGTSRQELVGGIVVDVQTQQDFGLLTLNNPAGSCSASMLNDYWAITAAHCVYPSTTALSVQYAPSQITLTANWPGNTKTAQAVQVIAFSVFPFTPNDVALLQMGRHAFDRTGVPARTLNETRPMANLTVEAFGRGINQLAFTAGGVSTPTVLDGLFRSAQFDIASINPNSSVPPQTYSYQGKYGAIVAGGDSGGPSYLQDWDDPLSTKRKLIWKLIGVHSRCSTTCLAGKNCTPPANPWTWVASVQSCSDATTFPIRAAILAAIENPPPEDGPTGSFSNTVPDSVLKMKRALYALSIDEPLVAPAGAAIDIQLTFQMCHDILQAGTAGCPVGPAFQIWSYDPAAHRVLHVLSGKCLNISGARRDAGAPIILYPCSGAPNEKWTVTTTPGRSTWTIKSDLTGQCLAAIPGSAGSRGRRAVILGKPATLAQMPCNGDNAQLFDNVDSGWAARNGPR